jgi:3-carboxy-cis,cis-muconate cycloisomerase
MLPKATDETTQPQAHLPLASVFGDAVVAAHFSEVASIESWLEVERALAAVEAELGIIPLAAAEAIARAAVPTSIDLVKLHEKTRVVGYPILPLIEQVAEQSPGEVAHYIHWGATTQDIMDTALAMQLSMGLKRAADLLRTLGDALAATARDHRSTILAARTHAQHAVPTTLGSKLAVWLAELSRHLRRIAAVRQRAATVQLFGAGGTAAALGPHSREIRHRLAERLELNATDVPWHVARDSLAEVGFVLVGIGATCCKIAREVIELSRPEIHELSEASGHHHGASSTMPQKVNQIDCEAVVGMSSLAMYQLPALLTAMTAPHERSAGEWQIEWDVVPTIFVLTCGSLRIASRIAEGLQVFPERMTANLRLDGGLVMAEAVMMAVAAQLGRTRAHERVYEACARVRQDQISFADALAATLGEGVLGSLPALEELLRPENYLGEAEAIVDVALREWREARASFAAAS